MFGSLNKFKNFGQSEVGSERILVAEKLGEYLLNGRHIVLLKRYSDQQLIVVVIGPPPESVKSNIGLMSKL